MSPGHQIYEGKAKKIFSIVDNSDYLWIKNKDDLTAFNAVKKGSFTGKGIVNNKISELIYNHLEENNIETHFVECPKEDVTICKKVKIIPLEVVVRNKAAGSIAKKFGLKEGMKLSAPLVEFFYKKDELSDPFISTEQVINFGIADAKTLKVLQEKALKINEIIKQLFLEIKIDLIDFKVEFGVDSSKKILLADEISPDCCRLWDAENGYVYDKDRFRKDMGQVKESYNIVLQRLEKHFNNK